MQWINDHRIIWGAIILLLLPVALLGTWGFSLINVPAQYDCSPNIRLEGDLCGMPLPGFWGIVALISAVVGVLGGTTMLNDLPRILPFLMVPLPFISALLWLEEGGDHPRQWIFHLVAWGLAAIFIWFPFNVMMLTSDGMVHLSRLWGLWLYTALVTIVFFIEIVQSINRKRYNTERSLSGSHTEDSAEAEALPP